MIACRQYQDTEEFRLFRKQLYHASLTHILQPLHRGMTVPHVMRCPDGHFRRVIFQLGPFIADYPEQVLLAGIVQNWCPKYTLPLSHVGTLTDNYDHVDVTLYQTNWKT